MALNKRIINEVLNAENISALFISTDILSGYAEDKVTFSGHFLKYTNGVDNPIQSWYGIDVSGADIIKVMGNKGEVLVDYNGQEVIAKLVYPVEYDIDRVNQNGEGITIADPLERIGMFTEDASGFTEVSFSSDRREVLLDADGTEVRAEFLYSLTGSIFGPPVPEGVNVIQWLGDTFQDETTDLWYQEDKAGDREGEILDGSYLDMNGTDNYVDTGIKCVGGQPITVDFDCIANTGSNEAIFGCGGHSSGFKGILLRINVGNLDVFTADGTSSSNTSFIGLTIVDGERYTGQLIWDGLNSIPKVIISGTTYNGAGAIIPWSGDSEYNITVGAYAGGTVGLFNGDMFSFGTDGLKYYFDEKDGDTVFDTSGNGNHGTLQGTITAIRQESLDVYSYNNQYGYNEGGAVDPTMQTSDLINASSFPFTTFTGNGSTGFIATSNSSATMLAGTNKEIDYVSGKDYLVEFDMQINSGFVSNIELRSEQGAGTTQSNNEVPINGANSIILTATATTTGVLSFRCNNSSADFTVSNLTIRESYPVTVFIPANQSNLSTDAIDNTLLNKGKVRYDAQLVNSNCVHPNGIDNSLPITTFGNGNILKGSFVFESGSVTQDTLIAFSVGTTTIQIRFDTSLIRTFQRTPSIVIGNSFVETFQDVNELQFEFNSLTGKLIYIFNGVTLSDTTDYNIGSGDMSAELFLYSTEAFSAKVHEAKLYIDDVLKVNIGFAEGVGSHYNKVDGSALIPQGTLTNYYTTSNLERPNNLLDGFTEGLTCITAGTSYKPSTQAYGVWEFDIYKESSHTSAIVFINDKIGNYINTIGNKYILNWWADDEIYLTKKNDTSASVTIIFNTANNYAISGNNYRIKIERNSIIDEFHIGAVGSFAFYIKGGSFGNDYVLVDVTGGVGTNPATDNTHTTSNYFINDLRANNSISNLKLNGEQFNLFDFFEGTGTYDKVYLPVDPTNTGEALSNPGTNNGHNNAETQYLQPEVPALITVESNLDFKPWYGVDKVVNGNFDTTTDWTLGTGASISDGKLSWDGTQTAISSVNQAGAIGSSETVDIVIEVLDISAGSVRVGAGGTGNWSAWVTEAGTYTYTLTNAQATTQPAYIQGDEDFIGSIDKISFKLNGDTTPVPMSYSTISYDYETKGYWFADVLSEEPTKFNWTVYDTAIVEPDYSDVLFFMNSNEKLYDVDGSLLLDINGEQLYALKEGLV